MSQGDMFYRLFLSDVCLGKACYDKCKYRYDKSSADIRIGDLWGKTYKDDEKGVSAAIAFTAKGDEVLRQCDCELIEHPFEVVAEGQMKSCPKKSSAYKLAMELLRKEKRNINDVNDVARCYVWIKRFIKRLKHPVSTTRKVLKKLSKLG